MKIEKIKPIPKYIARKIISLDKKRNLAYNKKRFYAYFTKNDGELVKVTVAARSYQGQVYLKQVAVHGVDSNECFARDIECHYIAGYMVGWYDMGLTKQRSWYEDGKWYRCTPEKAFSICSTSVCRTNMPAGISPARATHRAASSCRLRTNMPPYAAGASSSSTIRKSAPS